MSISKGNVSSLSLTVHSLVKAATIAQCKPSDLLHYGSLGKIQIGVCIPGDIAVFEIGSKTLDVEKAKDELLKRSLITQLDRYERIERPNIEMLALSMQDCKNIESRGSLTFSQSIFYNGWEFKNSVLEKVSPLRNKEASITGIGGLPSLFRLFATYPRSLREEVSNRFKQIDRQPIALNIEQLFITNADLQHFIAENPIQREALPDDESEVIACDLSIDEFIDGYPMQPKVAPHEIDITACALSIDEFIDENSIQPEALSPDESVITIYDVSDDKFKNENITSEKLKVLIHAVDVFWAKTTPKTSDKELAGINQRVKKWLKNNGYRTPSLIEASATIIRPIYARQNESQQRKREAQDYRTPELKMLVDAWKKHWANADPDEMSTYPLRSKVIEFLNKTCGLSDRLAKAGATIIRPENMKKGRRKIK